MIPGFLGSAARWMVVPLTNKIGKPRGGGRIGLEMRRKW